MTDDIDIFLVTESHRLWVSFLKTLLLARVFNTKALIKGEKADFCLSYVQDEEHLKEEIEKRRTLLFAREFLSINVLSGITYHNELLKKARWMRQIFPRLYETKLTKQSSETVPRTMNRRPVRKIWVALDLFTYVMLRNYLMFKAFSRNIEYRKKRRMKDTFEAIITKGSCVYNSARYRELESMYPRHL